MTLQLVVTIATDLYVWTKKLHSKMLAIEFEKKSPIVMSFSSSDYEISKKPSGGGGELSLQP